jgi:poly(3-hydroxybutyrate) depolymerase
MTAKNPISTGLLRACLFAAAFGFSSVVVASHESISAADGTAANATSRSTLPRAAAARSITIAYRAHDGRMREATVLLPHGYRPGNNPPIPLIISPHGRGVDGKANSRLWGNLPTIGRFAVVNPDGEGRRLPFHSWGAPGQIRDLGRMPQIVETGLPWVQIDRHRIFAVGGSMGGQETLLLVARQPRLLAGAVAVDAVSDFPLQYRNFLRLKCNAAWRAKWGAIGSAMQRLAAHEVGGTPQTAPAKYAERSPLRYARAIAKSDVKLQIWWSREDRIVIDSGRQSGAMYAAIVKAKPQAAVDAYIGSWMHTKALNARRRLPMMLAKLGLLPSSYIIDRPGLKHLATTGVDLAGDL